MGYVNIKKQWEVQLSQRREIISKFYGLFLFTTKFRGRFSKKHIVSATVTGTNTLKKKQDDSEHHAKFEISEQISINYNPKNQKTLFCYFKVKFVWLYLFMPQY